MPHKDFLLERTNKEDKYSVGQIINRWGSKLRITRIVWDRHEELWLVFAVYV